MIGENVTEPYQEEVREARARFTRNYLELAGPGASLSWLYENWEPLLRVAVPQYDRWARSNESANRHKQGKSSFNSLDALVDFYTAVPVPA